VKSTETANVLILAMASLGLETTAGNDFLLLHNPTKPKPVMLLSLSKGILPKKLRCKVHHSMK
jgi:hypothetical protein